MSKKGRRPLSGVERAAPVLLVPLLALVLAGGAQAQGPGVFQIVLRLPLVVTPDVGEARILPGEEAALTFAVANPTNRTFDVAPRFAFGPASASNVAALVEPKRFTLPPGATQNVTLRLVALHEENDTLAVGRLELVDAQAGDPLGLATAGFLIEGTGDAPPPPVSAAALALAGAGVASLVALRLAWRREAWRYAALLAALPLYTRLARAEVLAQDKREAIYKLIEREPGVNFTEILRRTGLASGVVVHHLQMLERHGYVTSRREGGLRRFSAATAVMPPLPAPLTPMQECVLRLVEREPMTQRRIADALGITPQGANQHVKALERRGLLVISYEGGEWLCKPASGSSHLFQS